VNVHVNEARADDEPSRINNRGCLCVSQITDGSNTIALKPHIGCETLARPRSVDDVPPGDDDIEFHGFASSIEPRVLPIA
jgi:hypothetical protein